MKIPQATAKPVSEVRSLLRFDVLHTSERSEECRVKKEEFNLVIGALQKRLDNCEKYLGEIKTTEDLKDITIGQALELRDFCVAEVEKMTKIAMVDLYHIIGMGDLSVPQMMKFIFLMKAYLAYRPNIKSISKHLNHPNIPPTKRLAELGSPALAAGASFLL